MCARGAALGNPRRRGVEEPGLFWRIWTYTGPCMRLGVGCTRVRVLVDGVRLDADLVVQAHIEDEASDEEPEV